MSNVDVEIPPGGRAEALGPPSKTNKDLYMAVIIILGLVLLVGVIGWLVLANSGKEIPDGLGVILGTVAGGLVGLIGAGKEK